jgi:hypothetical protein
MKKLLPFFLLLVTLTVFGQGKDNSLKGTPVQERIVFGGGMGLSFGSQQDFISLSPLVGYRLTAKLTAGTSVIYRYTSYKVFKPTIKLNDYGVSPFVRFTLIDNVFLQAEYEYLNYEFPSSPENFRKDFTSFLAGGGFIQPLGGRASFFVIALYNFSYQEPVGNDFSPYPSPLIIRAGIGFGF